MLISPKAVTSDSRDAYLVVARYLPAPKDRKSDFPIYTVICDGPEEAIDFVLSQGFVFTKGQWSIRAIHVALVGEGKPLAMTALPK